ncbi:hypothetical protein KR032_001604, partial [Drosophila birchii]
SFDSLKKCRKMSSDIENEEIFRKKKSFSTSSLSSISLHSTGQKLAEDGIKWLSIKVTEDIKKLLNESGKYARRTRDDRMRLYHIQHAARTLCPGVFNRLLLRGNVLKDPVKAVPRVESSQLTPKPRTMQLDVKYIYEPDNPSAIQIRPNSPLDSAWLKKKRAFWMRQEQAVLMPCKNFPLTKEQLDLYQMLTESVMGASDGPRQLALYALSTDPTLDMLLPRLSIFISEAVLINVAEQNIIMLFFLMRTVKALLTNKSLNLDKYLHLILPAVLSCLLTKQLVLSIGMVDHWSLREYSGSIATEIVRHYEFSDNRLLTRVIGVYKDALLKKPLTTMYGAVIGLGKMGDDAVRACILPKLIYLSQRIEPHLKNNKAYCSASLHTLASKFISHRLMKMCTPLLDCTPRDSPEVFSATYGLLGPMLRSAVIVSHVKSVAEKRAR